MPTPLEDLSAQPPSPAHWRTRFAPSPTGYLHLGHVVHALYLWGIARLVGAEILFRIEDHDRQRCRPEYEQALLEDMDWLGLNEGLSPGSFESPMRQSGREFLYVAGARYLFDRGKAYVCDCSRAGLKARTGQKQGEPRYDGHCRERGLTPADNCGLRVRFSPDEQRFQDVLFGGELAQTPALQCGDMLLRDRFGQWTYQFCVVVDDLSQQINLIVRGEDLRESTGRQLALRRLLDSDDTPFFAHHPLLVDSSGAKLSKRDFAAPVRGLREAGVRAEEVWGRAVVAAGLRPACRKISLPAIPDLLCSNLSVKQAVSTLNSPFLHKLISKSRLHLHNLK